MRTADERRTLSTLAVLQGLSTEGALVNLALGRPGEGKAVVLELGKATKRVCQKSELSPIATTSDYSPQGPTWAPHGTCSE